MVHATTVAVSGRAALIRGRAGAGKSALALQLIALGAGLVADDRTSLRRVERQLIADAPPGIAGRIEARGVGLLMSPPVGPVPVSLIVDLDRSEPARLPPWHEDRIMGLTLPLIGNPQHAHFPAAILLYLRHGRSD